MSTIPQPLQDPSPSPEAILAGNNARMLQTVQQFGPAQAADRQYQFDREQALQAQRIAGEKDIAQWHEKAAQIRSDAQEAIWDKRIKAQAAAAAATEKTRLESIDERELGKAASGFQTGSRDPRTGLYVPPIAQNSGESLRDYVVRAGTERAKYEAERDATIDKNSQVVQNKITGLMSDWDKQNQNAAHSSGVAAINDKFVPQLSTGHWYIPGSNVRQAFQDTLKKNLAVKGTTYEQALAKTESDNPAFAGATDTYNETSSNKLMALRAAKSPMLESQVGHLNGLLKNTGALAHGDFTIPDLPAGPAGPTTPPGPGGVDIGILNGRGGGAPGATQSNQFLPDGLQSPDALSLASRYHPMGANLAQDTGDILGNAVAGAKQKIAQGQAKLHELGVAVGPDGKLIVPPTKQTMVGAGFDGRVATMATPMSPAERQQRYSQAQSILQGIQQTQADLGRLSALGNPALSQSAAADFGNEMSYPTQDQTLSGR